MAVLASRIHVVYVSEVHQVVEDDILALLPCVRQNRIAWYTFVVDIRLGCTEPSIACDVKQSHRGWCIVFTRLYRG
jgi:hypothetical protein